MRLGTIGRRAALAAGLLCLAPQVFPARGDEPTRLGRFFRLGAASEASKPDPAAPALVGIPTGSSPTSGPVSTSMGVARMGASYPGPPALSTPPTTPAGGALTPSPRISPKPRVNKPTTEADPLVSRIALGRADGGSQFGIFMQVYADGTVIDGEGVHKISPELLKPVVEAVSAGEFSRLKGHCGGPAGDTYENFHVVTYERAYGRLRANSFSYSGNPQGCDHSVHHLHKVLEDLQMKMATVGPNGAPATSSLTPAVVGPGPAAPAGGLAPLMTSDAAPPAPMAPAAGTLAMPSLPDPGLH